MSDPLFNSDNIREIEQKRRQWEEEILAQSLDRRNSEVLPKTMSLRRKRA